MIEKELMARACLEAQKSEEPLQCGVVIAKGGEIISIAYNSQRKDMNATAHAEIKAIAEAGRVLANKNLEGCTVYCSCEPCTMCLSALIFAKIEKLYYAQSLDDVSSGHIRIPLDEFVSRSPRKIEVIKNFLP